MVVFRKSSLKTCFTLVICPNVDMQEETVFIKVYVEEVSMVRNGQNFNSLCLYYHNTSGRRLICLQVFLRVVQSFLSDEMNSCCSLCLGWGGRGGRVVQMFYLFCPRL